MLHSRCPRNPAHRHVPRSLSFGQSSGVCFSCDISFMHNGSLFHHHDACAVLGAERQVMFDAWARYWTLHAMTLYAMRPGFNATCGLGRKFHAFKWCRHGSSQWQLDTTKM